MDDYILKLKFTQIDLPPHQRLESKLFPKSKIRTSTPKCTSASFNLKSLSRPISPKSSTIPKTSAGVRHHPGISVNNSTITSVNTLQKHSDNIPCSLKAKLLTRTIVQSPNRKTHGRHNTSQEPSLANPLLICNLQTNLHYSYKVKNPARILNIPSPKYKIIN